jgi:hypothetical protein
MDLARHDCEAGISVALERLRRIGHRRRTRIRVQYGISSAWAP